MSGDMRFAMSPATPLSLTSLCQIEKKLIFQVFSKIAILLRWKVSFVSNSCCLHFSHSIAFWRREASDGCVCPWIHGCFMEYVSHKKKARKRQVECSLMELSQPRLF